MLLVLVLCSASVVLALFSFAPWKPATQSGPKLAVLKLNLERQLLAKQGHSANHQNLLPSSNINAALPPDAPTFGHPIIAGIGGTGFEESIRVDPTLNANGEHTIYTSAPGSLSADTSWVWHSLDGGKSFKWVVGAAPLQGKVTTCHGGGDSEIAVDQVG
ncbi:MAG TPA: hypothetical protein VK137_04940, partial [Planctomycetaceae bacterium]|nr:hypothetical protein [Planctomycetaceae bacterium]